MTSRQFANRSLGVTAIIGVVLLPIVYVLSVAAIYMLPPRPGPIANGYYMNPGGYDTPTVAEYEAEMLALALFGSVCVAVGYVLLAGLIWGTAFVATRLMIPEDAPRHGGPPPIRIDLR